MTRSTGRSGRRTWRRLGGISVAVLIEQMRLARAFLTATRAQLESCQANEHATQPRPHRAYPRLTRITKTSGNGGVESERTGQSSSGLDEGRSWYHLKHCKWVLGSTSTMSLRPTDGCRSAGAAVLRLMVRRGFTSRTNDNWSVRCNGLMRSRYAMESTARRVGLTTDGPEIGTRMATGAAPVVLKMKASVISPAEQLAPPWRDRRL